MAKRGTLGYQAEHLRRKGQRRIERLEAVLGYENTPKRVVNWATEQIREIKSAMQGTRQYTETGKRDRTKTQEYIKGQISRLEAAVKEVAPRYTVAGDSFTITQNEMNRASVDQPSVYTKEEVQTFYRITQKVWQQEGVSLHDRNEAILDHYNRIRRQNGLSSIKLDELVDYVLENNKTAQAVLKVPYDELTEDQKKFYERMMQLDNTDSSAGSPPGVTQLVVDAVKDALEQIFSMPDVTQIQTEE